MSVPRPQTSSGAYPPPNVIGLVAARSKREARELAVEITAYIHSRGATVVQEDDLPPNAEASVDCIIVLGGDGLMMRAAKSYPNVPLLGINFGKVGFLALVERSAWKAAVDQVLMGDYDIEESSSLTASLETSDDVLEQGWAINDVVIRSSVRMIEVEVYVNGFFVNTYPGDGMIVSTSRGSTAYGMAAGGPILTSGVRGFAIVPISCHSPIRTPVVVEEEVEIELLFNSRYDALLILDGQVTSELAPGDLVRVRLGENKCRLISTDTTNFYEAFRTKFNFRIRPDAAPTRLNHRTSEKIDPSPR